jgi:hypothetical protein
MIQTRTRVTSRDKGWKLFISRAIDRKLRGSVYITLKNPHEVHDETKSTSTATNLEVLAYNEFGTEHVPERPAIRNYFDRHQGDIIEAIRVATYRQVFRGLRNIPGTIFSGIKGTRAPQQDSKEELGAYLVDGVKAFILAYGEGTYSKNAPDTLARKAADFPLIDTWKLFDELTYKVKDNR